MNIENIGRLTLPTDVDMVETTIKLKNMLGADALRDCDGTTMPEELLSQDAKIYATYYTTRKDNHWAMQNPEEIQQEYLISDRVTAKGECLRITLMKGFHTEQLKVNTIDSPKRWWEVIDRTTGEVVPTEKWNYDKATGEVVIETIPYHQYTVSFLAFLIWDPVHMYNFITNDWKDAPHQLTYDVRQPKTQAYVKQKLKKWCEDNPHVNVVRFTTFFHQFTLTFDDQSAKNLQNGLVIVQASALIFQNNLKNGLAIHSAQNTQWTRAITTRLFGCPLKSSATLQNFSKSKYPNLQKNWWTLCTVMARKQ